ncbi:hypothetical protein LEQ04_05325 [Riemerella anatipestifer]|nr:hypothetical protein LEQ04_05325 [Riemerella anatipestifer]
MVWFLLPKEVVLSIASIRLSISSKLRVSGRYKPSFGTSRSLAGLSALNSSSCRNLKKAFIEEIHLD